MRGHETVLALRRRGMAPASVTLNADGNDPIAPAWQRFTSHAHVSVEPGDNVAALDLRFVVGLLVFVDGTDEQRCDALHAACMAAGASRVFTHVMRRARVGDFETVLQRVDDAITYQAT